MTKNKLNAWAVDYRFLDRGEDAEWATQCWFPALDIVTYDNEPQGQGGQGFVDIGQARAYKEAHDIVQRFGSNTVETWVHFVNHKPYEINAGKEVTLICRYDEMTPVTNN